MRRSPYLVCGPGATAADRVLAGETAVLESGDRDLGRLLQVLLELGEDYLGLLELRGR